MRFSAVGGRAGLQAGVPGLDEIGFSRGGNARSIYEMGYRLKADIFVGMARINAAAFLLKS